MATVDSVADDPAESPAAPPREPVFGGFTSAVAIVVIFVLAVVTWWGLGDPRWGIAKANNPAGVTTNLAIVGCFLFWVIFAHIFTGFTFANWPFNGLSQPLAGFAHVVTDLVIGAFGVVLFTRGVGAWDPTFSANTAAGAGYTAAAFVVLIGFYAYALPAANLAGYPFEEPPSPSASLGQWLFCAFLTTIGTVALIYPNFNAQLAAHAPIALPDVTGWIYSSIVVVIVTAMILGNWPWASIKGRHTRALVTFASTLGGGFLLMLALEQLLRLIVPASILNAKDFAISLETAQLGVCIAYCSLTWGLIIAPTPATTLVTGVVRTLSVAAAGVVVYVVFMRFFATRVLHFPAVEGTYGGNPLLWIDWMILLLLWHAVAFGGYFSTRPAAKS